MIIRSIKATPVNIPFAAPYKFSYGTLASVTKTIIELVTEDGVIGLGECADGDRAADVEAMGSLLVGRDATLFGNARRRCLAGMAYSPWSNALAARRAYAGIEMAMWDARGKTENVPLWHMLGGKCRDEIPLTEYFSFRNPGPNHPGESTPVEIARFCGEMIEKHDSKIFEGKLATVDLSTEIKMVREVRAAIGNRELRLDANGAWTLPTARRAIRALEPHDVSWYEEPVESYEEMAALRSVTSAGISSHQVNLRRAAELGAPDAIVTNVNELGGIAGAVEFIKSCELLDVGFRFHSGESGVASAVYLHLSATLEHVRDASQTLFRWYADDVIEGGPFSPVSGCVRIPEGSGIGATLDPRAFERCHQRYRDEGPFPSGQLGGGYGDSFQKT